LSASSKSSLRDIKLLLQDSQMPLNGNLTLTSLKVRLGMFSLFPVHRLTSGLTVFAGFFKPEQFPTARIL
jgi:hypothetical protein